MVSPGRYRLFLVEVNELPGRSELVIITSKDSDDRCQIFSKHKTLSHIITKGPVPTGIS